MRLSNGGIRSAASKILGKIMHELELAQLNDTVEEVLEKYGFPLGEEEPMQIDTRSAKILVFGTLAGRLKDYQIAAKKLGIDPCNIVFEIDYQRIKHYDVERLRYSFTYSDIIIGCMPHNLKNLGDASSLFAKMKNSPNEYPRVLCASESDLKLSVSGFKNCITRSRLFEALGE